MLSDIQLVDSLVKSSSSFAQYVQDSIASPYCHAPKLVWRHEIENEQREYCFTNGCTFCLVGNGDCEITDDAPPHPDERDEEEDENENP